MENFRNSLSWYAAKRLLQGIPLIIVVVLFCFTVIQLAPGSPLSLMGGSDGITPEQQAMLEEHWGLNESLPKQLLSYSKRMLTFDLGTSYRQSRPVAEIILERLPATLLLLLPALMIAVFLGVSIGMYCARHMHSLGDSFATVLALAGYSVPLFWIGQMLILIFSTKLGLLPVSGLVDLRNNYTGLALVWDVFKHLVLPGSCLVFYYSAMILRVTRTKMAEVLQSDYIKTARAKGLQERRVIRGHALRNALAPVVTVIGMELGAMVMGATVVESVFGYPGTGRLIYDAVAKRDYPLIAGMFFFISVMVIVVNILVDILYAVIDPQVRYNK
jgi:peptide/nickel transport system permease protein